MLGEADEVEKMAHCISSLAHGMAVLDFNAGHRYALERVVSGFSKKRTRKIGGQSRFWPMLSPVPAIADGSGRCASCAN